MITTQLQAPAPGDEAIHTVGPLSEVDALQYLSSKSAGSLFRGQNKRYITRNWPPENTGQFQKNAYLLDSIVASDSRGMEKQIALGYKKQVRSLPDYGTAMVMARVAACSLALTELSKMDAGIASWALSLQQGDFVNHLVSLGQHVGLPTGYIDLTSDPSVALWFACYAWSGPYRLKSGEGVVYRFDKAKLASALQKFDPHSFLNGIHELSGIPPVVSRRPANQRGYTAYNLDTGRVLLHLIANNAIEAIMIKRDGVAPLPAPGEIKTSLDPMRHALKQISQKRFRTEWNSLFRELCKKHLLCPNLNLADRKIKKKIFGSELV